MSLSLLGSIAPMEAALDIALVREARISGACRELFWAFIANGGVLFRQRTAPNAQRRDGIKSGRVIVKKVVDVIQAFLPCAAGTYASAQQSLLTSDPRAI
jgi:hypothetical protein